MTQSYFVLPHAPFVVLAFLGTAAGVGLLLFGASAAFLLRKRRLAVRAFLSAGALLGSYAALLLVLSAASRDHVLQRGDRKYFCEVDCHVAYSLEGVTRTEAVGNPPGVRAAGVFRVVTLKTWFDPSTISPFRGNFPLTPNPRIALVLDASGGRYPESFAAERALEAGGRLSTPLWTPLRPGDWYTTVLVFDLPAGVVGPRLLLADPSGVENVLLGHENSPFHGKITFALDG